MTVPNTARAAYIPTCRATRARVGHHMSIGRRHAVIDNNARHLNARRGIITAAQYLTDALGADTDFVRRFASPYGGAVRKVYEAEFGAKPPQTGIARVGRRLFDGVYAYTAEHLAILAEAARSYSKTAALIAA